MTVLDGMLPSKCCCCNIRCGAITVGCFAMLFSLTFLVITSIASHTTHQSVHEQMIYMSKDNSQTNCPRADDIPMKMVANSFALLALLNAVEFMMSAALIWGVITKKACLLSGWLIVTFIWFLMHSEISLSFILSTSYLELTVLVAVCGVIILMLGVLSVLVVLSYRNELIFSQPTLSVNNVDEPTDTLLQTASAPIYEKVPTPSQKRQLYTNAP